MKTFKDIEKLRKNENVAAFNKLLKIADEDKSQDRSEAAYEALDAALLSYTLPKTAEEQTDFDLLVLVSNRYRELQSALEESEKLESEIRRLTLDAVIYQKVVKENKGPLQAAAKVALKALKDAETMNAHDLSDLDKEIALEEAWMAAAVSMFATKKFSTIPEEVSQYLYLLVGKMFNENATDDDCDADCMHE